MGSPLRPWTIPNLIGFARLLLVPAFLALSLIGATGVSVLAIVLFAACGWGDYADGLTARLTGQYSRLGALMDPLTDRLLAIAGVVVCWRYDLLPRWALAVLVARELVILALSRYGLSRGLELRINWPGRLSILPLMGGLFFAMVGLHVLGEVLFFIGLTLSVAAALLYLRDGVRASAAGRAPNPPDAPAR